MKKTAIITGSSEGIGKAITKMLLKKNYDVYGYSRSNSLTHKNFNFRQSNLSDLNQVKKIKLPNINKESEVILINNAATIGNILPLNEKLDRDIIYEYNLNLISPVLMIKKFINKYPSHNKLIINISSGAANKAIASWSTYCSAKSAIDAITNVLNVESYNNLNVFSFYPGIVDTKMQKDIRGSDPDKFPLYEKFIGYYRNNELFSANYVSQKIMKIIKNPGHFLSKNLNIKDL